MPLPVPAPGLVICYAYLWHDEYKAGGEEGRKDRPCAIVVATTDADGDTAVWVAPITHARPDDPHAVLLPPAVKQRLGLDDHSFLGRHRRTQSVHLARPRSAADCAPQARHIRLGLSPCRNFLRDQARHRCQ